MTKAFTALLPLVLAACTALPPGQLNASPSPCALNEASYECQVERYHNVNVN